MIANLFEYNYYTWQEDFKQLKVFSLSTTISYVRNIWCRGFVILTSKDNPAIFKI